MSQPTPTPREPATATPSTESSGRSGPSAREINETIRYTMWSVFSVEHALPEGRVTQAGEVEDLFEQLAGRGVTLRGWYDVGGLRADADVMGWWHGPDVESVQAAYRGLLRTTLGRHLKPVWSVVAVHRPAEFNKGHVPAFMGGEEPRAYLCVYPFVRSYDWYLLPDEDRRRMLVEHGVAARSYPDVRANTVSSFALGDYEWILAFEADELHRIVDLMRDLRATDARLHVRVEVPFYTGPKVTLAQLLASLP